MTAEPKPYTEEDWNESSLKQVEEKGSAAGILHVYSASKTLAERGLAVSTLAFSAQLLLIVPCLAAWNFYETHKGEVEWDLTIILPPYVS